jgi:hypothetical protein
LIDILDNGVIRTNEKIGSATVLIEEGNNSNSDQLVMLNIMIAEIFAIQVMDTYKALNMPLGTRLEFPIHFTNSNGHLFAENIELEDLNVGVLVSHPRIVNVELSSSTQKMRL